MSFTSRVNEIRKKHAAARHEMVLVFNDAKRILEEDRKAAHDLLEVNHRKAVSDLVAKHKQEMTDDHDEEMDEIEGAQE